MIVAVAPKAKAGIKPKAITFKAISLAARAVVPSRATNIVKMNMERLIENSCRPSLKLSPPSSFTSDARGRTPIRVWNCLCFPTKKTNSASTKPTASRP